ncbi:hypothetical protein EDB85DRAFT_1985338 [Lactarius pseudohatsudake]|nr:hypothetical protein EDB85DRAFT_1985338 [Lactarius pseudohatsudake]
MMLHSSARQAEEEAWICLPSRSHAVTIVIAMAIANFVDRPTDLGLLVRRLATPSLRQRLRQPSHRPAPPTLSPRLRLSSPPAIPTSLPPSRPLASPLLALPRPAFACSRVLSSWLVSFCLTPLRGILSASNLHGLGSVHLPSLRLIVAWYSPTGPWYSPALPSFPPISPRYHPQSKVFCFVLFHIVSHSQSHVAAAALPLSLWLPPPSFAIRKFSFTTTSPCESPIPMPCHRDTQDSSYLPSL